MVWPYEDCLNIRISKTSLDRGLILLNTIFRELEAVGFQIYISDRGTTVLEKDGTEMTITLSERSKRSENPPPLKDTWWHEKYSFAPSGELEIILGRWPIGESRWKDTAVRSVEMRIKDIIIGILESSDMVKREEATRAEEAEHERRLAQEYEERRRIEPEESQRKNELENQVAKWRKADQLRQFVAMAETVLRGHCVEDAAISLWVEWAINHANDIDPLTNGGILQEVQGNSLQPFG